MARITLCSSIVALFLLALAPSATRFSPANHPTIVSPADGGGGSPVPWDPDGTLAVR